MCLLLLESLYSNKAIYRHPSLIQATQPYTGTGRGFDSHRGQKNFFFTSCGSLIPFTRANAQWVFHGLHIVIYISELILCSTIHIQVTQFHVANQAIYREPNLVQLTQPFCHSTSLAINLVLTQPYTGNPVSCSQASYTQVPSHSGNQAIYRHPNII